jgi:hypothetical protein
VERFPSERLKSFASICNKSLIGLFVSYNPPNWNLYVLNCTYFLKLFYMCGNDDQVFTSSWWSIWEQLAGTGVCGARATCKWLYPPWWNVSVAALLSVVKTPSKHNIVQHHVMNAISIRQVYYTPPQFHHFDFRLNKNSLETIWIGSIVGHEFNFFCWGLSSKVLEIEHTLRYYTHTHRHTRVD